MKKKLLSLSLFFGVLFITVWFSVPLAAETIDKITIEGNKKVSKDTALFYMRSREKGLYSEKLLKEDFHSLWKTGFFEDIIIESEDGTAGKIVKVKVKEYPLISSITYKSAKKIKDSDITDKLQENNIVLTPFSYYNPSKIKKVKRLIKELMLDKGYNQGKVEITEKLDDKYQMALVIHVNPGPKTRIGKIVFPGLDTKKISPSFLRSGIKTNRQHSLFSAFNGSDVYNREKMNEDIEEIRLRLHQKGYLEAKIGTPAFSLYHDRNVLGKIRKMMKISIPIQMGPRYRMGDFNIEGNKIIKTAFIKSLSKLKKGDIYNVKKRNDIIEQLGELYSGMGYIYHQAVPVENLDPVKKIADLTLRINEGKVVHIGKLEFSGNTFTRDHVLRREWFLREGQRLNMHAIRSGITRMKQLGLVDIDKAPEFKPNPQNPQEMDIKVNVKEINRQMVNFNFGFGGYEGWFVALGYSTKNFLGRGETLSLQVQSGTRTKQYRLSFAEPYLFGTPVSLGFSVHHTNVRYIGLYDRKGTGFSVSGSGRFWRFWGASLGYSYEDVTLDNVDQQLLDDPSYAYYLREGKISSLSPTIYYSTVDSPLFPARGSKILFNWRYSGGFLGGTINTQRTKLQLQHFVPLWKRHVFGIQFVHQQVTAFGDTEGVPYYERIYLGGEQNIRGFNVYTISPRSDSGYAIGGTKAFYINTEYTIPINEQLSLGLFCDVGNVYDEYSSMDFKDVYSSLGLEIKVFVPMLNVPFRLIFAYNPRTITGEDPHFAFRFGIGPSFQ